jgi:GrpB-like predicted nucleotidyltransferase (UPF0157 family)
MSKKKTDKSLYQLSEYDPGWKIKFQKIKAGLERFLPEEILKIEHVGSTSIPNMKSKPVIDVLAIIEKKNQFETIKNTMLKEGYEFKENYIEPNSLTCWKSDDRGEKIENVHFCLKNSFKSNQLISMRDYLIRHPEKASEYSQLKEELYKKFPNDYIKYREGKRTFLEGLEKIVLGK